MVDVEVTVEVEIAAAMGAMVAVADAVAVLVDSVAVAAMAWATMAAIEAMAAGRAAGTAETVVVAAEEALGWDMQAAGLHS